MISKRLISKEKNRNVEWKSCDDGGQSTIMIQQQQHQQQKITYLATISFPDIVQLNLYPWYGQSSVVKAGVVKEFIISTNVELVLYFSAHFFVNIWFVA